ncbi:MAG: hypothetical protein M1839_006228 [Geoglossum umbratile]|nr:MAG: hypothetical protein M1839_006228 [Geoglossum umbratile]
MPDTSRLLVMPSDRPLGSMPPSQCEDGFTIYPWEILEAISELLLTADALILRLDSRSFALTLTTPKLQNRKRVWSLVQIIKEYLRLRPGEKRRDESADMSDANLQWDQVRGDIRQELGAGYCAGFGEGSRIFGEVQAFIPRTLFKTAFSVVQAGEADYVVGFRLICVGEDDKQLGYSA